MYRFLTITALAAALACISYGQGTVFNGCQVLPSNNVWNTPVDKLPVHPNSDAWVRTIGLINPVHPDFGTNPAYGLPYNTVNGSQAKVKVTFQYASESDPGPYPIPANPIIEGGSDKHMIVMDTTNCVDYELYGVSQKSNGAWTAGSGAVFPLTSNQLRPAGWTSADAAGLPIFPGLIRYDEVASGAINHAIRFTAPITANSYLWPARHEASLATGSQFPPMGARFRLKQAFDVSKFPQREQVILNAMKKYGIILADNGSSWYISGVSDSRWDDSELHLLTQVTGANLEALDESSLMLDPNSGQAKGTAPSNGNSGVLTNQWIKLISKNSGKCLEATASWSRSPVEQRTCSGAANQSFMIVPVSGGYKITAKSTGLQLNVKRGSTADGAAVIQYPFAGYPNETWTITPGMTGYFTVHPVSSNKCLEVSGLSLADGAQVWQWSCNGGDNQQWSIQP
jgi:Ricin-type beta-trefoil lectin domain